MKPAFLLPLTFFFLFTLGNLQAQDKIVKRNGETIECKIVEILTESVKYQIRDYGDVLFEIPVSNVEKLVFATGKEIVIDHAARARESVEANSQDLFLVQRKSDLKVEFVSPLYGTFSLSYERATKPARSWEVTAGIIGVGVNNPDEAFGFATKIGLKFMRSPDYYIQRMRYAHILKGSYVRPEIAFASYQGRDIMGNDYSRLKIAFFINFGKQVVFADRVVLDYYGGLGYGYTNDEEGWAFPYVFAVVSRDMPLSLCWGFRIGFMLPGKKTPAKPLDLLIQ